MVEDNKVYTISHSHNNFLAENVIYGIVAALSTYQRQGRWGQELNMYLAPEVVCKSFIVQGSNILYGMVTWSGYCWNI